MEKRYCLKNKFKGKIAKILIKVSQTSMIPIYKKSLLTLSMVLSWFSSSHEASYHKQNLGKRLRTFVNKKCCESPQLFDSSLLEKTKSMHKEFCTNKTNLSLKIPKFSFPVKGKHDQSY